jgi:hypothetical protein
MYIALRPVHIAGRDYRIDEKIPDECVTPRLEVTGFVKRVPNTDVSAPILEGDGSISTFALEPENVKSALIFLQQTPANAAKSVSEITSKPLLEYLKRIDSRKAVQEALSTAMDGGEKDEGSTE